jgi:cell division protein FtsZ
LKAIRKRIFRTYRKYKIIDYMEKDTLKNNLVEFELSNPIKVIGIGGCGSNTVNHIYREGVTDMNLIVCDSDGKSLELSPVSAKILLGTTGLGTGGKPEVAKNMAIERREEIRKIILPNTKMLFIVAGMGGGTGTGAAHVVAEIAKSITDDNGKSKIHVGAVVTTPLSFEGPRRKKVAEEGIQELKKHVDSITIMDNDKLSDYDNLSMANAFKIADDMVFEVIKSMIETFK